MPRPLQPVVPRAPLSKVDRLGRPSGKWTKLALKQVELRMALGRDLLASAFSCEMRSPLLELRAGFVLLAATCRSPPST